MPTPTIPNAAQPALLWDIFCRVIDNHGDLGVCWRLASDLAARGHKVRLWVDDASALQWMAPHAQNPGACNLLVLDWNQSNNSATLANLPPADVWIEAFGCEIAPEFIAHYALATRGNEQNGIQTPVWINLEYLTAEAYASRCHGLPSPVMQGPTRGWTKHFFYPGFQPDTGGLLREPHLLKRQQSFDKAAWLAKHGIEWQGEQLVSLFCYEPSALNAYLQQLRTANIPTKLLVTHGRATAAVKNFDQNRLYPSSDKRDVLSISYLPALSQTDYDHLLWACDLNFVRGEDSLVRAIWAGKPFVWQIYPQDDGAHAAKLHAFLDVAGASDQMRRFYLHWNDLTGLTSGTDLLAPLPAPVLAQWQADVIALRSKLLEKEDLTFQLQRFVLKNR
jgi:uncharacterized repeat protein (TIGR03837 family)